MRILRHCIVVSLCVSVGYAKLRTPAQMREDYASFGLSPNAHVHDFYQLAQAYSRYLTKTPYENTQKRHDYRDTLYAMFTDGHGWWGGFSQNKVANKDERQMGLTSLLALSAHADQGRIDALQARIRNKSLPSHLQSHTQTVYDVLHAGSMVLNSSDSSTFSPSVRAIFSQCQVEDPLAWRTGIFQRCFAPLGDGLSEIRNRLTHGFNSANWDLADVASRLITPHMNRLTHGFNSANWDLADVASRFITPHMNGYYRAKIIKALSHVTVDQWAVLEAQVQRLITPDMEGFERARIIEALNRVPVDQWAVLEAQVQRLITPHMEGFERDRIIDGLSRVPAGELTARVQRVLDNIDLPDGHP